MNITKENTIYSDLFRVNFEPLTVEDLEITDHGRKTNLESALGNKNLRSHNRVISIQPNPETVAAIEEAFGENVFAKLTRVDRHGMGWEGRRESGMEFEQILTENFGFTGMRSDKAKAAVIDSTYDSLMSLDVRGTVDALLVGLNRKLQAEVTQNHEEVDRHLDAYGNHDQVHGQVLKEDPVIVNMTAQAELLEAQAKGVRDLVRSRENDALLKLVKGGDNWSELGEYSKRWFKGFTAKRRAFSRSRKSFGIHTDFSLDD